MIRARTDRSLRNRMPAERSLYQRVVAAMSGVDGFVLDSSDVSTLNQLSTGTTQVTAVSQPVGLWFDKRFGLKRGPELVLNGVNPTNTTGWTPAAGASINAVNGEFVVVSNTGAPSEAVNDAIDGLVVGKTYLVSAVARSIAGAAAVIGCSGSFVTTTSISNTTVRFCFIASAATANLYIRSSTGGTPGTAYANNITCKLLDGNHALQATAAARPTWQSDANGKQLVRALGTDDSLSCAIGGGGTAGFFFCCSIKVTGGAGTKREIYSDAGANIGIKVEIDASNKLSLSAGNGAAFTTLASTATVDVGTLYMLTAYITGGVMYVQINSAAAESVAAPTISAGTAGYTLFKDNGAAADFMIGDVYHMVYAKNTGLTAAQRALLQAWVRQGAGL